MPKVPLNILIEPDDLASLDRIADRMAITRSDVVRNMIREMIPAYARTSKTIADPRLKLLLRALATMDPDAQLTLDRIYGEMEQEGKLAT